MCARAAAAGGGNVALAHLDEFTATHFVADDVLDRQLTAARLARYDVEFGAVDQRHEGDGAEPVACPGCRPLVFAHQQFRLPYPGVVHRCETRAV